MTQKIKKPTRIYSESYKEGDYTPEKKELINLIERDLVTVSIVERSKYSDGSEKLKIVINHL